MSDFTGEQKQGLLDLLVLGMYADGHLGLGEDERLKRVLGAMGVEPGYDQHREIDRAVTRVSSLTQNPEAVRGEATRLAALFADPAQKLEVYDLVQELISSDGQVAPAEDKLLGRLREVFRL